ncbi:hypothetical protein [Flavobacterium sedimenticola]|uniref:DUF4251 domain-containing protein n=1 Tax=Flavobacterium sedimenticola TaxID=3043286 RepID=A0ABT6XS36_9FLAO|nr:hypothetical protein [Flavobacterium sedimenticola]MDI9257908.1 hypothetical protein [Flavobacterium sedimenticola]
MKTRIISIVSFLNLIFFAFYLFAFTAKKDETVINYNDKVLKVRGIVIVDSLGIERAILGAHIPEPNFANGHRIAARGKGGSISGLMLYDHEGQERGGYVTDDGFGNVFLTLDSKTNQQVLLIAEPQGGAAFKMWDRGDNSIHLNVTKEASNLEIIEKGKLIQIKSDEK